MKPHYIDLQMHSHYSDGSKSPSELITLMHKKGVAVAALTDHNTIHGQYEFQAAAKKYNIKAIPGVELYASFGKHHLHILGYNIDINNTHLHDRLRETQIKRKKLIERLVPKLHSRGISLDIAALFAQPATYIGVANVIRSIQQSPANIKVIERILKKKTYDYYEVYNALFGRHLPTHLPEIYMPLNEVIRLIKRAKGVPVIAHPGQQLKFENDDVLVRLKAAGVAGLECFSSHHNWDQTAHYVMLAKRLKMIITGGSDYHGDLPEDFIVDNYLHYTSLPLSIYQAIKRF